MKCPPPPALKLKREACHLCGARNLSEAETKCRPSSDETGERFCGCDTFDDAGFALGPTIESMVEQERWYREHAQCFGECSFTPHDAKGTTS